MVVVIFVVVVDVVVVVVVIIVVGNCTPQQHTLLHDFLATLVALHFTPVSK